MQWVSKRTTGRQKQSPTVPPELKRLELHQGTAIWVEDDAVRYLDQQSRWNGLKFQRTDFFCNAPHLLEGVFKKLCFNFLFMLKGSIDIGAAPTTVHLRNNFYWLTIFDKGRYSFSIPSGEQSILRIELHRKHIQSLAKASRAVAVLSNADDSALNLIPIGSIRRDVRMLLKDLQTCKSDPPEREWLLQSIIKELLAPCSMQLKREGKQPSQLQDIAFTREAFDAFMNAYLGEELSIAGISKHFAMSPTVFKKRFTEFFKVSVHRYILQFRLQAGIQLLLHTGQSIYDISLQTGFAGASHFIRTFKKRYGVTPHQYRKGYTGHD